MSTNDDDIMYSRLSAMPDNTQKNSATPYEQLLRRTMSSRSVQQILNFGKEQTDSPMMLYSVEDQRLYLSENFPIGGNFPNSFLKVMEKPEKFTDWLKGLRTEQHSYIDRVNWDLYQHRIENNSALSMQLKDSNGAEATLVCFCQSKKPTMTDAMTLRAIGLVLESRSLGSKPVSDLGRTLEQPDKNAVALWLRDLGGDRFQNYYIAVCKADEAKGEQIRSLLCERIRTFRAVTHNCHLVILTNCEDDRRPQLLRTMLNELSSKLMLPFGLSGNFLSTTQIHSQYCNALMALEYGNLNIGKNCLYDFTKLRKEILIYHTREHIPLEYYCLEDIDTLIQADSDCGSALYETLKCYLSCGGIKQAAGEKLNIHRNTMAYRLNKIAALTHVDLEDERQLLSLWFSIIIHVFRSLNHPQDPH